MIPTLESLLDRGRSYLDHAGTVRDERYDPEWRQEVGLRALRAHSTAMRDLDLADATALLAAVFGAVKWHERQARDGDHLNDALQNIEDAMASLEAHFAAEDEPELPLAQVA